MQSFAAKDARGIPPNINPPRTHWMMRRGYNPTWPCYRVRVYVARQRYDDVVQHFTGGAFIHKWWSWYIGIVVGRYVVQVWRWRERWAV